MKNTEPNAILDSWSQVLAQKGSARAIVSCRGETLFTFADIEARAGQLEEQFLAPFPARAVIAVQIGNHPDWPALLLALLRRSLVCLPLPQDLGAAEHANTLSTLQTTGVVGLTQSGELTCSAIAGREPVWTDAPPDLLKLTSGTESAPRGVRFRASQLVADCTNICETMEITEADLNFGVIPFSHSYGFSNLVTPLLCRGVPLVPSGDRLPRALLADIETSGATIFPGMPLFFQNLGELDEVPALKNLRYCISAGAPLASEVAHQFTAKSGLKVHSFYGASECGGIAFDSSPSTFYEEGFVGQPLRNVTIELAEPRPDDPRKPGPICIRSAAVGDGFFPDGDSPGGGPRNGTFIPADLALVIARGVYLVGRTSDFINIAGRKLHPREIETALRNVVGVRQVVAFGVPSALRHEEVVVCMATDGSLTADEIIALFRERLSVWQVPKDVWLVNEIPVNERGKISRRELAREYAERLQRAEQSS